MKPTGATLVFYAAATFLLGAIAYAVLTPFVAAEGLRSAVVSAPGVPLGVVGWLRLGALGLTGGGPIVFIAAAAREGDAPEALGAAAIVLVVVLMVGLALTIAAH